MEPQKEDFKISDQGGDHNIENTKLNNHKTKEIYYAADW